MSERAKKAAADALRKGKPIPVVRSAEGVRLAFSQIRTDHCRMIHLPGRWVLAR